MSQPVPHKTKTRTWFAPLAGAVMAGCLAALVTLPSLRGPSVVAYLAGYALAGVAYLLAVSRLGRDRFPMGVIWGFALLFRLILLFTFPTLSDDVYRYIWDGHLLNLGANPYTFPVNAAQLNAYTIPERQLVNHDWMASPYLPVAQALFALVTRLAPQNILAFQIAAALFDLLTGWLVMDILRRLALPPERALIYLWNPLVIVEFAHAAHVDALMLCLVMVSFWLLVRAGEKRSAESAQLTGSALALAAATLTKGLPLLFVPLLVRRWGWARLALYLAILALACVPFALGAGWGLVGPLDGSGLFGALRIYLTRWNFNSGVYHWLEVWLSGYPTPGAVPFEFAPERIRLARLITTALTGLGIAIAGLMAWRVSSPPKAATPSGTLAVLRLSALSVGLYLLFTHTVHPWYVALLVPFLPLLLPGQAEAPAIGRFLWPGLYFSLVVALSYLTYLDPENLREYTAVRLVEYLPTYLLCLWAIWPQTFHRMLRVL